MKVLADGTYLAELKPPRKKDGPVITVRVIEYTVHAAPAVGGQAESSEVFCLVTSLLDLGQYPALDLACCHPDRWGCETVTVAAFPPDQRDLALATFLLKILAPGFAVRNRPGRNSPRKSRKAGDFPARQPGEPSVTNITRYIQFRLLEPWMIT